uniref:G-protein coupled receptor 157-like n=2 Tax=Crassostrea virginica TaxID=6565 RepID=A0A8B8CYX1_CRAVI|nr:G-protein coupled receptor 157-like [Crassostrea virginica]
MPGLNLTAVMAMNPVDRLYLGLGLLTSFASLVASVALLFTVCCIPAIRNKARYIVLYIVMANVGASIGTIMSVFVKIGYPEVTWRSHPACESAAAITVLFRISGYLWTITLALYLCLEAWKKKLSFNSSLILWPAHCICWGFPLAIMLTLVALDVLGSDTGKRVGHVRPPWCFIDRQIADYNAFSILAGTGWRMAAIIICSIAYLLLQYEALRKPKPTQPERRQEGEQHQKPRENPNRQLRHLLVIFVLLNIWGAWHFLISHYRSDVDVMVGVEVICDNLQGFVNTGFFFLFISEVRRAVKKFYFRSVCDRCCKRLREANVSLPVEMEQLREEGGDHAHLLAAEDDQVHFEQEPGHKES